MNNFITPIGSASLVDPQAQRLVDFLRDVGLPYENIMADPSERSIIASNLPGYLQSLPAEVKRDARYLSKFVIGAGSGLFDYALNAIWNEVVVDLRKKASLYGLDIFFDAAVGGSKTREFYRTEDDLAALKDAVLLDTCRKLELISDTTYKKLKHILDMRNDIGISHPNSYNINAFELLGWLQTCVQDVLHDRPTEAALQVQAFITNLKGHSAPLDQAARQNIERRFTELPSHLCGNLLRTVFGIYVAPDTDQGVRKNIAVLAPALWNTCPDEPRYRLGIVLEGYNTNLYRDKYTLGEQFFGLVGGNAYRSASERLVIVDTLIAELSDKHNGWDNFHHEAPVAANLWSYVPDQSSIFDNLAERLFKTVLLCRIGRGVSYNNGVSPGGRPYYDKILSLGGDKFAPHIMAAFGHYEIAGQLGRVVCRTQAKQALEAARTNVINQRLIECLSYLINNIEANPSCATSTEFKRLSADYIRWN
ncbi:hypothetical protein [Sinorhizobium americanum]|uniref:Uncharacterized protein n=1 Tax=Sinorhizobium americanum TaxID=194963 RepID=A0A1L3LV06_9HYPH|nr:hypothetical protein [Sinorhizobium americanum]APG93863.1 hypothetical protein SAMCFNEI73_pC0139 [Sinorhizobium americanum]OAP40333.1 hypothetical protein ATC00_20830 [Sinorhizobium americanum]